MKILKAVFAVSLVCGLFLGGCCEEQTRPTTVNPIDKDQVNQATVAVYSDRAIENAILTQHTLYPYHFEQNSVALNHLGERDLGVLTKHYRDNPGQLVVRRGTEQRPLYMARRQAVIEHMMQAGIPQESIRITDGMPGGDGMASGSVIEVLIKSKEKPEATRYEGGMQGGY